MEDSEIKKELRQLLVQISNWIEIDEKNDVENKARMKLENDNLKRELWQMNEKIQQLSDDLQQKELIIGQKDEIIVQHKEESRQKDVQFDEKLKKNNDVIKEQAELLHLKDFRIVQKEMELAKQQQLVHQQKAHLNDKDVVIGEQNSYIDDLNEIIDKEEMVIISKEDVIDEKINIIKNQKLKIFDLNNMITSMNQHIQNLEETKKQSTHYSNGKGSIMYNRLKMHHRNSLARCQQYADKIAKMEEYIINLHSTLERNQIFDDTFDVTDVSSGVAATMDSQELFSSENDENKDPNLLPVRYVKIDVPLDRVKSDLLNMMDESEDCVLQMSNAVDSKIEKSSRHNLMKINHKNSFGKKSSTKKIQQPRKKVKFSNIVTVALY